MTFHVLAIISKIKWVTEIRKPY